MDDELLDPLESSDDDDLGPEWALLEVARGTRRSGVPDEAGRAAVEEALEEAEEDGDDPDVLVVLLHAKCEHLRAAARFEDALTVRDRELDVADAHLDRLSSRTAQLVGSAVLERALILGELGRNDEALAIATAEYESAHERSDSAYVRLFRLGAASVRLGQLGELGRACEQVETWITLARDYEDEQELRIRRLVASLGAATAADLVTRHTTTQAIELADAVIGRFRIYEDPRIRAAVAVAMQARIGALRRRGRVISGARGVSELMTFLGPDPEPDVIAAMRRTHPKGAEAILRGARRFES